MSGAAARLKQLEDGASTEQALALFDSLPPIGCEAMVGAWRGSEVPTGHAFDGLLEPSGWWGKHFHSVDAVDPLVFQRGGRRFAGNPGLMPLGLIGRFPALARAAPAAALFRLALPLLRTRRPRARLRLVEYRGAASAAMVYDQLPIIDCFRAVDGDTLLGAMDIRGHADPYFFVLRRA